ncbi:uncharacterized protein ASCRUDRAFT_83592 [Ascoidea rubescens DSM 1968]|uniref:Uncharacterized protein n=1 Tax=Ascoidea rubescens DSM 1968 TaxID=1344418 RepID=A0A1D2VQ47_9ASCO|nr:hypothetical protein ASCRUDRAFT_83592 [Ascoidea rubescens DSM 1968]ODV63667.1 hypothetical protein ASCRUDRAFT_83592 [Ascoidea rubescens DSM 1968]
MEIFSGVVISVIGSIALTKGYKKINSILYVKDYSAAKGNYIRDILNPELFKDRDLSIFEIKKDEDYNEDDDNDNDRVIINIWEINKKNLDLQRLKYQFIKIKKKEWEMNNAIDGSNICIINLGDDMFFRKPKISFKNIETKRAVESNILSEENEDTDEPGISHNIEGNNTDEFAEFFELSSMGYDIRTLKTIELNNKKGDKETEFIISEIDEETIPSKLHKKLQKSKSRNANKNNDGILKYSWKNTSGYLERIIRREEEYDEGYERIAVGESLNEKQINFKIRLDTKCCDEKIILASSFVQIMRGSWDKTLMLAKELRTRKASVLRKAAAFWYKP